MTETRLPVVVVLDNIRSAYNVGSIWRTAEAVGAEKLVLTGITPHPGTPSDNRLPHVAAKDESAIAKTALGAEKSLACEYFADTLAAVSALRTAGYAICALEQDEKSVNLFNFEPQFPLALILGHERDGLDLPALAADHILEIPQFGRKESLNVSVAAGIALYQLRLSRPGLENSDWF